MKADPSLSRRKKLKLVCSFNGRFRRRSSDGKLRYTGGEARIISVDPTSLTYSKLRSTISDLFRPGNPKFTLKYQLPGSEPDCPLVLVTTDDDVRCMIEEFDVAVQSSYGKTLRLWLFVCNNNGGDFYGDGSVINDGYDDDTVGGLCETGDLGGGFRVSGRNLGFKRERFVNGVCKDFVGKSGMNVRRVSDLRKLVLKQQLLARKRDQILKTGGNYDDQTVNLCPEQNYHHPWPEIESTLMNDVSARSVPCNTQLISDQNLGVMDASPVIHPRPLNPRNRNLFEEKNPFVESSPGGCGRGTVAAGSGRKQDLGFGRRVLSPCLNRENITPCSQDCNGLNSHLSCGNHGVGDASMHKSFHRGHEVFILNDGRNQRIGYSFLNGGSHRMVRMDRKPSFAARCYPGLRASTTISKQGHAMRLNHPNSLRPFFGSRDEYRALETKRLITPQWNHYGVDINSPQAVEDFLIDLTSNEHGGVKHDVPYEHCSERIIQCEPHCQDANMNVIHAVPQSAPNLDGMVIQSGDYHTGCHPVPDGVALSIDLSSYNPSLSSSKFAPPAPSHASCEVSKALKLNDLKVVDPVVEEKVAGTKGSTKTELHSVDGTMAKAQHDEKQSMDVEVDLGKFHNNSSILNGNPCDLQKIKESDLEYIKELGSGNYGIVYHGKWKGSDVAIKKIKLSCISGDAKEEDRLVADFWKEAHMLGQLHHPNIVAFYGVVTDGPITNLATVTEYMINGSLKQVLQKKDRTIDRRKRLIIAMGAAFGMEYLHEKKIVHFDLKSHNFLVNMRDPQHPVCKIGDLGLSKMKQRTMVSGGVRGTIPWMAPELLSTTSNLVTEKVDVYSFGIVMWELLTGEEPYANMHSQEIIAGILKGTLRPEIPSWCDPAWRSLMERCWSSDPDSRPSFSEVAKELRAMSAAMNIK